MLKSHLKVILRQLLQDKLYILIVLFGLTTAFAVCLLIFLYIYDEFSYDRFHEKANQIVRVGYVGSSDGEPFRSYYTPPETGPLFSTLPEVEALVRIRKIDPVFRHRNNLFQETEIVFATEQFFDIFNYSFVEGDPNTALQNKYSIVLTRNRSERYFGAESPIGKTMIVSKDGVYKDQPFIVTGVIEDIPHNTSFNYDMILSHQSMRGHMGGDLNESWAATFLLLRPDANYESVAAKLKGLSDEYFALKEFDNAQEYMGYLAQPILSVHLSPPLDLEWIPGGAGGSWRYLSILLAIAVGILLIACINYINLTIARSIGKIKVVGIRKAIGASRLQLFNQQFMESIGVVCVSVVLAIPLAILCIPLFNGLASKALVASDLLHWPVVVALLGFILLVGLIAGIYPAYFSSRFNPISTIKGDRKLGKGSLQNGLILFQYALSAALIIFSVHVFQQLKFMKTKDLGFDRESLIVVDRVDQLGTQKQAFIEELKSHSSIVEAGISGTFPGRKWGTWEAAFYPTPGAVLEAAEGGVIDAYTMRVFLSGPGLATTMGLTFVEGRDLITGHAPDSSNVLVNQKAVETFGWNDPIGTQFFGKELKESIDESGNKVTDTYIKTYTIVGVVEDFNYLSLENEVEPFILLSNLGNGTFHSIIARTSPSSIEQALVDTEASWRAFLPDSPLMHFIVDHEVEQLYERIITLDLLSIYSPYSPLLFLAWACSV